MRNTRALKKSEREREREGEERRKYCRVKMVVGFFFLFLKERYNKEKWGGKKETKNGEGSFDSVKRNREIKNIRKINK